MKRRNEGKDEGMTGCEGDNYERREREREGECKRRMTRRYEGRRRRGGEGEIGRS